MKISFNTDDRESPIDRIMRLRARESRRKSSKMPDSSKEIQSLTRRKRLFKNDKTIFTAPDISNRSHMTKVISLDVLIMRAQVISSQLRLKKNLSRLGDDFFDPFDVTPELESLIEVISSREWKTKERAVEKLLVELIEALSAFISDLQNERARTAAIENKLPAFFMDDRHTVDRAIITRLLMENDESTWESQRRRFHSISSSCKMSTSTLIDRLSILFSESELSAALAPNGFLIQNNYLILDLNDLHRPWHDVEVSANPAQFLSHATSLQEKCKVHRTERIEQPKTNFQDLSLAISTQHELQGFCKLVQDGKLSNLSVLLHGEAGTGKTSVAHALAHELGYQVVTVSADGLQEKSLPYAVSYFLNKYENSKSLILFDECESLWYGNFRFSIKGSSINSEKGAMKQVLENASGVVVFTSNVEPPDSFSRRVSYATELKSPDEKARKQILEKEILSLTPSLKSDGFLNPEEISKFAAKYELSGGYYRQALLLGAATNSGALSAESIEYGLSTISSKFSSISSIQTPRVDVESLVISPKLKNEISRITAYAKSSLQSPQKDPLMPAGLTVLFEGPSGTGKTVLAEAIASELGLRFRKVTPSSFLSKWVGETEKRIKSLLREAQTENYVLFLDEAEGMLHSREASQQSWEKTQVDEWLNCLENFSGVFIAATNHKEMMDSAFARRFLFKVAFDYPNAEDRKKYLMQHLSDHLTESDAAELAKTFELSFGELRNSIVQIKTYSHVTNPLVHNILDQQVAGRSGGITRRIGL